MNRFTLDKLPKMVLAKLDLETVFMASRLILAAEKMQIFRKLHKEAMTADELGRRVRIHRKHRLPFLGVLTALGLVREKNGKYSSTALADKYFVRERSIYWTKLFTIECLREYQRYTMLEQTLATGKNYETLIGKKSFDYLDALATNPRWAGDFTHMLYYHHIPESKALSKKLDLRGYRTLLDIGGGSGVMSIALARKYPHLKATVLDTANVVRTAKKIIREEGLSDRVKAIVGDMHREIPSGYDVIMLCDVDITDYSKILKTAFKRLPEGGMVVVIDEFASEDLSEPLYRMLLQLRSSRFWMTRRSHVREALKQAGFRKISGSRLYRENWVFTGRKPG